MNENGDLINSTITVFTFHMDFYKGDFVCLWMRLLIIIATFWRDSVDLPFIELTSWVKEILLEGIITWRIKKNVIQKLELTFDTKDTC